MPIRLCLTLCLAFAAAVTAPCARAQQPPPDKPTTITMTVRAKATTRPALAVKFLPRLTDLTAGDAAQLYLQATARFEKDSNSASRKVTDDDARKFGLPSADGTDWSGVFVDAPLAKLRPPSPELDRYLNDQAAVFELVEIAAGRESCRWELPLREQGFHTLLPHLSPMRGISRALYVRARVQLARGDVPGAIRSLRVVFTMARHLNEQAVLVQSLVSAAVAAQALAGVREAAGVADVPNLYWALGDLPRPMMDARAAMEWERAGLVYTLPQLRKVRDGTFTDGDWRALMKQVVVLLGTTRTTDDRGGGASPFEGLGLAGWAVFMYPSARRHLLDAGMTAEQVDAQPQTTVLARYLADGIDEAYDELSKWTTLPYWQARTGLQRLGAEMKSRATGMGSNPLYTLFPSVDRAVFNLRRLDRDVAATQAVEALRDYAARHGGALPTSLDEVTETPVPLDPIHGKPFVYKVDGNTVTLESPPPPGGRAVEGLIVKATFEK